MALAFGPGAPGLAQQAPGGLTFDTVDPPVGDTGAAYERAAGPRVSTRATYATEVHGGRLTPESRVPRQAPIPSQRQPISGGWSILLVVGLLALALFLWLRFGGGGILAGSPRQDRPREKPPESWSMDGAEDRLTGEALLRSIAAMPDRRAAMVRLLRHCLLHVATVTGTRLARSDTERRVLSRLPAPFGERSSLADLLGRAELAHYGGREVPESEFAASLAMARDLLASGGAHA